MIKHAINDEFLDVDFPSQPQFVFGDRGKLPFQEAGPCFEDIYANYTDKEIEEAIEQQDSIGGHLDLLVTRIYDQKQEGSCVGNATCQAIEIVLNRQHGPDRVVHLSAISPYKQIGTSPNSGAYVSDGWKAIHSTGVLPLDNEENRARFKHVMPNTGFHLPYPAGWKETAALFRGLEYTPINTLQGLKTASVKGFPIVVGVYSGAFFGRLVVNFVVGGLDIFPIHVLGSERFSSDPVYIFLLGRAGATRVILLDPDGADVVVFQFMLEVLLLLHLGEV